MTDWLPRLQTALADRYSIDREIGRGGMSIVYLARDLPRNRFVALKVFRPDIAAVLGPDRFLDEIQVAAGLAHPHILPLFDSDVADGLLFYTMHYVEGTSSTATSSPKTFCSRQGIRSSATSASRARSERRTSREKRVRASSSEPWAT